MSWLHAGLVAFVSTDVSVMVMLQLVVVIACSCYIHSACYGIGGCCSVAQWVCQRCQAGTSHHQDCCLCLLRGGALKPTDGGRWAHLVCAVTIPDVCLGNVQSKEPVVTENITRARRKLVGCDYGCLLWVYSAYCLAVLTVCFCVWRSACSRSGCVCSVRTTKMLHCNARHLCTVSWATIWDSSIWDLWFPLPQAFGKVVSNYIIIISKYVTHFQHSGSPANIKAGEDVYIWKDKKYVWSRLPWKI